MHTYLVQILTADKAEIDPQVPNRQSETKDIRKMKFQSSKSPRLPAFYEHSSFISLIVSSLCKFFANFFSLHCSCSNTTSDPQAIPNPLPRLGVPPSSHQLQNPLPLCGQWLLRPGNKIFGFPKLFVCTSKRCSFSLWIH